MVHGALFEIPEDERPALDRVEGLGVGYREAVVDVHTAVERVPAWTYVASDAHVDDRLRPFRWYRDLVLAGATRLGFPEPYLDGIRAVRPVDDPNPARAARNLRFLERR